MPMYNLGDLIEMQLPIIMPSGEGMITGFFQLTINTPLPTTVRDEFRNGFWQIIRGICSNRVQSIGVKTRRIVPLPVTTYVSEWWASNNGGVISNIEHEGTCSIIVVDHEGMPALKSGRMYPPGSGTGYINLSYDNGGIGRLDTCVAALKARYALGGTLPVLMHMKRSESGPNYLYTRVTGYRYRRFLGMQRRRRPGVGS